MKYPMHRFYDDAQMDAFIAAQDGSWSYARKQLLEAAARFLAFGEWTDADYEAFVERVNGRTRRHDAANERAKAQTGRVDQDRMQPNGEVWLIRQVGGAVAGVTAGLQTPKAEANTNPH
ncbi:hypothetical protein [Methylobacterium sp. GC_Met_2]|uniref:hypothetical protein n=1 Tax=Methylobacterium sp. GC_Met_2 TaxID=2937376 RepID=UPI00226B6EE7|nr:hypothetical protein [Methylobacterium sp. GC_Met_2]